MGTFCSGSCDALYGDTSHSRPVNDKGVKLLPRAQVSACKSSSQCAKCGSECVRGDTIRVFDDDSDVCED